MEEEKNLLNEIASGDYDASDRPFDFVATDAETALLCEPDEDMRSKLSGALTTIGYQTTLAATAREALKGMRFHLFDMVVVNENFDPSAPDRNDVLAYLETLAMSTRRQIFVVLVSDKYRTMDNMAAFHKSVNIVINPKNIDDAGTILRGAVAENTAFYHVMKDILKKMGRI
jgi:DNA-binding NtrC family response regulator